MKRLNAHTAGTAAIIAGLLMSAPAVTGAATDIAPAPLANASTTLVKPNLMFIIDDSGSMDDYQMPGYTNDSYCKDDDNTLRSCDRGTPAFHAGTWNKVMYNPEITYVPPKNADGTSKESYDTPTEWQNVPIDGYGIDSTSTRDLVNGGWEDYVWCKDSNAGTDDNYPVTINGYEKCRYPIDANGDWMYPRDADTDNRHSVDGANPPYYYTHSINPVQWCDANITGNVANRGLGKGVFPPEPGKNSCSLLKDAVNPYNASKTFRYPKFGKWTRWEIKPGNTYPRAESRADCSGPFGPTGCTYAEEMTNFANWHAWYQNRAMTMKTAAGIAFERINDRFRVGYLVINTGTTVDSDEFLKIDDFTPAHKQLWFDKLYATPTSGGTPLRKALSVAGRYFANVTTGINNGISDDPIQYSCQQNFAILTSDGFWKDDAGQKLNGDPIGDHDSDMASAPRPLYDANSESGLLSDVAQYYYITDLRPTGSIGALGIDVSTNNVPGKSTSDPQNDTAAHQHMTTFTIGMGVDGTLEYKADYRENPTGDFAQIISGTKNWPSVTADSPTSIDDMWHTAVNGRGKYFNANNPITLTAGLTEALVGVNATVGSAAAAATSNLEPIAGDNFVYIANYETMFWNGDVEARTIDLSTGAVSASPVWSAQQQLDAKAGALLGGTARKIVFHKPGAPNNVQDFFASTLHMDATELSWFAHAWISGGGGAPLSQWSSLTPSQQSAAGSPKNVVYFLRGENQFEAQASNPATNHFYRDRSHVLGDIVNAQPVYVKSVNTEYVDPGFKDFKECMNTGAGAGCPGARASNVYVSANDGMLHALNGDTGDERWAFIPRILMPKLYRLADIDYANRHEYYVDGSPTVGDIFDPVAKKWRTILVGGLNSGGRGYYALDVTDPTSPIALWEFTVRDVASCPSVTVLGVDKTDCDLGLSYGNPVISKLTNGDWVVMVTSGYNNTSPGDGKGYLYVLDPITGVVEKKIKAANATQGIDPGSTATPLGLAKINNWVNDTNTNNTTLRVYGGDLLGNLWRIDPNTGTAYVLAEFKDGNGAALAKKQSITTKPELGEANNVPLIAVGTGRYLGASDLADKQPQTIYTIKDATKGVVPATPIDARGGTVIEQVITDTTDAVGNPIRTITSNAVDLATNNGWRVDLPITGERVNVDPRLQLGTLIVASNIPANDACTAGGYSYLNYFDYKSGSFIASSGTNIVGRKIANSLAVGISVVRLPNNKTVAIVTTSENKYPTLAPPYQAQSPTGRRNSWRELTQ